MSNKLTGNGRWESMRMILPEFREQYLALRARAEAEAVIEPPTRGEMALLHDCAILPMVRYVIETNRRQIAKSTHTLRPLYQATTDTILRCVVDDLTRAKRELLRANIYLREGDKVDGVAQFTYDCRGYKGEFGVTREYARGEVIKRIAAYSSGLFDEEKKRKQRPLAHEKAFCLR